VFSTPLKSKPFTTGFVPVGTTFTVDGVATFNVDFADNLLPIMKFISSMLSYKK